jgi:ABC-type glucose/galactose transport system permease subunit
MDAFSYLSVLLSIILGLAITQVLKGFRGLMQARARLRTYWPTVGWEILVFVFGVE